MDIGLPTRRGVGFVYASDYCSDDEADACLRNYLKNGERNTGSAVFLQSRQNRVSCNFSRVIAMAAGSTTGKAVGMAAGFIEPLEASALALVEWSAKTLAAVYRWSRRCMA